jgi:uncharacterized protein (DUF885 family)
MQLISKWRLAAALAVLFALCLPALALESEDARLAAFFQRYLDEWFELRPMDATRLGDHRFDARLDDLSAPALARRREQLSRALAALPRQVAYTNLSRSSQIDFEIFQHHLEFEIWQADNTRPFEDDTRIYNGYLNDSVYLLLSQSSLPLETNVANAIARMGQMPAVIAAAKQNLKSPPRVYTETAIRQNKGAIAFYESELFQYTGKTRQMAQLKAAARPVIAALKDYQVFLENELLPRANGEWRLGPERFAKKLDLELDADMTAAQVLADAESEFVRVERDMYIIARQLWAQYVPNQPLPPDDAEGRHTTVALVLRGVSREHGTTAQLTRDMKRRVEKLKEFIRKRDILTLPNPDRVEVVEMPEFRRGNSTAYMDASPPLDPSGIGQLAVSPPPKDWDAERVQSYLEEYNNHMLDILALHEGYPGHAVQLAYMNRQPSLIRRVLQSGAYIEGWAVYTEQMMCDEGYGEGSLQLRMNQLKFYLRAVANAILDHRMHCDKMSDDEAMRFLTQSAFQSEGEAKLKVIRAKQSSCQLSTYFVGRMAHYRLRQQVERAMGSQFNLGLYHEAVLNPGAVPVKFLPELVRSGLEIRP